ncbi:hypothetical protein [Acidimangrovimonas pyrenivorans]|uniref:Uncharacterized protein n=1 Tax=Acidimangrovimonas pyrenivorans TaxID=2030798 RepID=A0ABV7ANX4_9RHOB
MADTSEALAFFLEEADLGHLFVDWPAGMRLVICLDHDGDCAMLVYHADEEPRILRRAADLLRKPVGTFCVVPPRDGCPTRRMLFSEEQKLLALVSETENLYETASDYAINYAFAAEEGLDTELMTTGSSGAAAADPAAAAEEVQPTLPPIPPVSPHRAPSVVTPEIAPDRAAASARGNVPEGFRALSEDERRYSLFADGMLTLGRRGQLSLTAGDAAAEAGPAVTVDRIYFRDDLLSFAIPVATLREQGARGLPGRIMLGEHLFPAPLVETLARGPQPVRLTAAGAFIYVGLGPSRVPAAAAPAAAVPPAPASAAARPRRRGLLRSLLGGGAVAVLALLALQIGLSPAFSRADAPAKSLRDDVFAAAK